MNLAKETFVPEDKNNRDFIISSHSGLVNVFVNQLHDEIQLLNLWDKSQVNSTDNLNFEGKLMVVSPTALKEDYKTRADQLVFCTSVGSRPEQFAEQTTRGTGCMPEKTGKMVYGIFLKDAEKAQFQRQDFLGEAKDEFLSDFEKVTKRELSIISNINTNEKEKPKKRESVLGRLDEKKSMISGVNSQQNDLKDKDKEER